MPSKEAMKLAEEAERLVTQGPTESEIVDFQKMIDSLNADLTPGKMKIEQKCEHNVSFTIKPFFFECARCGKSFDRRPQLDEVGDWWARRNRRC
jgi:hypothetical protein